MRKEQDIMERELNIRIGKKTVYTCTWRSVIYMMCFFFLCVIDQRIKTYSFVVSFRNLTGVMVGILIISHYRWRDFKEHRAPWLVLAVICALGGTAALLYGGRGGIYNGFAMAVTDVVLYCLIGLHTFLAVVLKKRYPELKKRFFLLWVLMMLLMICSRSEYIWPFCYLVMFGCFYLTDFTREEREDMLQGAMNGIILGFFVMQGLCFVFRPYDRVRYLGSYDNSNMNALFYTVVFAAVLGKILYVHKKETGKAIKVFYWLGSGVVLSFLFLSIGRAAWVAAFFLVLVMLWALNRILQKKRFWRHAGIMILCACLMFPVCFSAVRYIPALFHHPLWFLEEYDVDKVHSFDPWDSWKYVEIDEFMEAALGRIVGSFQNLWEYIGPGQGKEETAAKQLEENPQIPAEESGTDNIMPGNPPEKSDGGNEESQGLPNEKEAVMESWQEQDSFLTRKNIYMHYAGNLNLRGRPADEQGFQLTPSYCVWHAHNIFLQYGTDFGIPVMVLFAVLVVWGALRLRRAFLDTGDLGKVVYLLFLLVPVLFGMFENSWGTGSLSTAMLFFSLGEAMRGEAPAGDNS